MSRSNISILAKSISSKGGLSQSDAERFISKMFEVANAGLQEDKQLKVRWLGTFKVTSVKDRESVDVNTGERIVIEGRDKISFTPDNILKEIVNKPFAQFETVVVNDGVDFSDIDEKFAHQPEDDEVTEQATETSDAAVVEQLDSVEKSQAESLTIEKVEQAKENAPVSEEDGIAASSEEEIPESSKDEVIESDHKAEQVLTNVDASQQLDSQQSLSHEEVSRQLGSEQTTVGVSQSLEREPSKDDEPQQEDKEPVKNEVHQPIESVPLNPVVAVEEEETHNEQVQQKPQVKPEKPEQQEQPDEADDEEVVTSSGSHHFVIPKFMVAIASLVFVILILGVGWLAFNYGKMQAQRDQLAVQLDRMKTQKAKASAKKVAPAPTSTPVPTADKKDSTQLAMEKKAKEDSIRMAAPSKAVEKAEQAEVASSKYDSDPRVKTGAYCIVGVDKVVTVKSGQSLASLSKTYLGPGMECYLEAVNGTTEVKEGQKVKIPKLELKKKKSKTL